MLVSSKNVLDLMMDTDVRHSNHIDSTSRKKTLTTPFTIRNCSALNLLNISVTYKYNEEV